MLATRTVPGLDMFRPSIIRVHETPVESTTQPYHYSPALSFPQHITTLQAIEALRQIQSNEASIYYLFVTDYEEHLVGVVNLWKLMTAPPGARLFELMDRRQITLPYDASLEEQALLMSETGLQALPVVDEKGRLVGALDSRDLITAMKEETTEQLYHLSGMSKDETLHRPLFDSVRDRLVWLMTNLAGLSLAALIVGFFASTLAHLIVLAVLLPMIIGQSRYAGMQTLTLVVRSLSLGKISLDDVRPLIRRELLLSTITGGMTGLLVGSGVVVWQGSMMLGALAGSVILANTTMAALAGVLVPLGLKKLHRNPAHGATTIVSTLTSIISLALFLSAGTIALALGYL
jgi:magnesium transporter